MSLSTLSAIAVQRDEGKPRRSKRKPTTPTEAATTEERSYANVLVSAIPTEPLALYTFLVAGIVATIDAGESERLVLRWVIYGVMIAFIAAWLGTTYLRGRSAKRKFPVVETVSAIVAFAAWGLVMPDSPLSAELTGDDRLVATLLITSGGVAILGLLGVSLKQETKKGTNG